MRDSILLFRRPADELAERWEVRAMREARGKTSAVIIAVIAAEIPMALPILLKVAFPGFVDIMLPALIGYAFIRKDGAIMANMIDKERNLGLAKVYESEGELRGDFRKLADKINATDEERIEMFALLKKWIAADTRIDHEGKSTVN